MAGRGTITSMALALAIAAPLATAAHQGDAGTGGDAPDEWSSALPVGPEGFSGRLDPGGGDFADWYAVDFPPGFHAFGSSVQADVVDVAYELRASDGTVLSYADFAKPCGGGCFQKEEAHTFWGGGPLYVGILHVGAGEGAYFVGFNIKVPSNPRLAAVDIVPRPVAIDAGDLPVGTQRTVRVTIENDGPGESYAGGISVDVAHDVGGARGLGSAELPNIPPGGRHVAEFAWDGTGEVGDVTVRASFGVPLDLNPDDNWRHERSYVLVGNVGLGVDAANNGASSCPPTGGCVAAWTEYNPGRTGLLVYAQPVDATEYWLHLGGHPGQQHAYTYLATPAGFTFVEAGLSDGRPLVVVCPPIPDVGCRTYGQYSWYPGGM